MVSTATPSAPVEAKYAALRAGLRDLLRDGLIVAYSGGVDSAFLLWSAEQVRRESGGRLVAVTAVSASLAQVEREDAARFAAWAGVEHRWEQSGELENPAYARNDLSRCYHCKSELFRLSHELKDRLGHAAIAYGYNASDRGDYRPGHQAAQENSIVAPLEAADLTKDDIRALMRQFGLPLADMPATTRPPYRPDHRSPLPPPQPQWHCRAFYTQNRFRETSSGQGKSSHRWRRDLRNRSR